jgi:glycosyltransferase involved in cell wall biosynthesis
MNIGIFSECYKPTKNGVVTSIDTFRDEFEKKGHRVFIFAPQTPGYQNRNDAFVFRFQSFRIPGQGYYPIGVPFSPKIKKIVGELNLDIIHVQSLFPISRYGRAMGRRYHIPVIMTYHTLIEEYAHYVPFSQNLTKKILIKLSKNFANSLDHIVTPSEPMKEILERDYGINTPISVIPTGIRIDEIPDVPASEVRKKYLIAPGKKLLFYGGRIAKEKNLDLLFKSFFALRKKMPNVHLIVAGDGPAKEYYVDMVDKLNLREHISFLGFLERKDIYWLFAGVDLFAFPSMTDTQGIVILEAFAGRTPVVAVNKLGPSKIIIDGKNGYLTKNSTNEFTEKIYKILKNDRLRERMAEEARKRAEQFTAEKMADRMLDLYKLVISQHKSS